MVQLAIDYEGHAKTRVTVRRSTIDDCKVTECLKQKLSVPSATQTNGGAFFAPFLELTPKEAPRRLDEVNWSTLTELQQCVDPDAQLPPGGRRLPPEVIQALVRSHYPEFRECYETGLGRNPELRGLVKVRFVIGPNGRVTQAWIAEATLPDCDVAHCVRDAFKRIEFPGPDGGTVTVVYPIMLERG